MAAPEARPLLGGVEDLEELEIELVQLLEELTPEVAAALVGDDLILAALGVANIFLF
ncbi:hypothetical protein KR51_00014170 [Rubidibacter lacunae KORDI 51-2]|uniref:Uncharacterized protein n=2 Tax=Rubidibacter TaxID=582491 RepID=U5DK69_9CHRO|nr:hypothetical protein KR51_00014170 [Rubidibacter lacunae KORDI 51-2]